MSIEQIPGELSIDGVIAMPAELVAAYRSELEKHDWLEEARSGDAGREIHGGEDEESSRLHFAHRFAGSCFGAEYVALAPKGV